MKTMGVTDDELHQNDDPTHHHGLPMSSRPPVAERMMEAQDPRRKARTIMATDSEWARIGENANARDMPKSRYVVQQALTPAPPQPEGLPAALQWRLAHHLMVLARIEQYRFERADESEAWQAIEDEVEALLEAEALMDGKERGP